MLGFARVTQNKCLNAEGVGRMQILADDLLATLPPAKYAPIKQVGKRNVPTHTLTIDGRSVTVAIKPLAGILRTFKGKQIDIATNPLGMTITAPGTTATLYDLDNPIADEAFEQWRTSFDAACAAQEHPYVVCPEFTMRRIYYDWEAPQEKPSHYAPEELRRRQNDFMQPPVVTNGK